MELEPAWISALASSGSAVLAAVSVAWSAHVFRVNNENSSRPYVSVSFVDFDRDDRIYFRVGNFGRAAARNITISFDDSLSSREPELTDLGAYLRRMYKDPGVTLSPGESKVSMYLRSAAEPRDKDEVIAPDKLTGTIRYYGPDRKRFLRGTKKGRLYIEPFELDAGPLKNLVRVSRSSQDVEQRLKVIGEKTDRGLGRIASAVASMSKGN